MTMPYVSAIGGLLRHAKKAAGIEDELPAPTPWNPNASPVQAGMQGVLSQGLGQAPVQGEGPGLLTPSDTHQHRKGLRGLLSHVAGSDRLDPEVAALLTPEQQERARGSAIGNIARTIVTGRTPGQQQVARKEQALGLQDVKKARDLSARQQQEWMNLQIKHGPQPPDPAAASAWTTAMARDALALGLPQGKELAEAADRLTPPTTQPRAIRVEDNVLGKDGNPYKVIYDGDGREIGRERQYVGKPVTWKVTGKTDADGYFVQESSDGQIRSTGVKASEDANGRAAQSARMRREDSLRQMTDDLAGVDAALAEVSGNPSAFGLKNALPTAVRQRLPWRDNATDAGSIGSLEYVVGRIRHDRFGGALTQLEASKSARIFSEPTSPPEVIAAQLNIIRAALARQQQSLSQAVEGGRASAPPTFEEWMAGRKP